MYSIQKTIGLPVSLSAQWEELDASSMSLSSLFLNFRRFIVVLEDSRRPDLLFVDFEQFRSAESHYENTLDVFIQAKGEDYNFATITALPNADVGYVKYNHAIAAGYHAQLDKAGYVLPENAAVELKTDIKLTRPEVDTDFEMLYDYCLFSVNGMLHKRDYDGKHVFITDGGKSCMKADNNQLGIYSFRDVSKLDVIPITDNMITVPATFQALQERVMLNLPEEKSIKSFFLVIGGYMVLPHAQSCWVGNDNSIYLDVKQLSMLERVLESRDLIDLEPLGLASSSVNPNAINVEELYSDVVIRKWLTLSQSFIVLLDTDNLFFDRRYIRQMRAPGIFTAYQKPEYPLVLDQGRLGEYWNIQEDRYWSVTLTDSFRKNYQHRRELRTRLKDIDGSLAFDVPFYFSQAYLLEMGAYKNQQ